MLVSHFLLSLHDPVSSKGAIGVFSTETGLCYLQIEAMSPLVKTAQIRGIAVSGSSLYAVTPSSLRKYSIASDVIDRPLFQLDKETILPEWLGAKGGQGNLLAIHLFENQNKIYVACNALASIDEFDMELNFIQRRYLWNIAPRLFSLPKELINNYQYGHIRNIAQGSDQSIYLTIAFCNNTKEGIVVNYDTGERVLENLVTPHGGLFYDRRFYVQNVSQGVLQSFNLDNNGSIIKSDNLWSTQAAISDNQYQQSEQNFRGMIGNADEIYCGVCEFSKPDDKQILPRMVSFDAKTGEQKKEVYLPDLEVFRRPRIFYMEDFKLANVLPDDALVVYQYGQKTPANIYIAPKPKIEPIKEQFEGKKTLADQAKSEKAKSEKAKVDQIKENSLVQKSVVPKNEREVKNTKPLDAIPASKEKDQNQTIKALSDNALDKTSTASRETIFKKTIKVENKSISISLEQVSLCYYRGAVFAFGKNKHLRQNREYWALKDISFDLYEGETVGLIGRNGSGKSTMGMVISGTLEPDKGKVVTKGRVQLLSLGIGFRKDLTGRDNVFISATLLGMTRKVVTEKMDEIEAFAELGEFIDEPVRTYSAGMRSRLAFAVATAVEPDILILDEVMSTGDLSFRKKAQARMKQMQGKVKTVVMVSHNSNQIKKLCTRVIWLEKGHVLMDGKPKEIVPEYEKFCQNSNKWLERHKNSAQIIKD